MESDFLSKFEYDLYLIREQLEDIHNKGTYNPKLLEEIKSLKKKENELIKNTINILEEKNKDDFKVQGNFHMYSGRHREDIKRIIPINNNQIILLGGHGFTALGTLNRKDIAWEYIYDFTGHIYSGVKISDDKLLVVGEKGECKILEKKGESWIYSEVNSPIIKSIYHIDKLKENEFLVMGDQGLLSIIRLNDLEITVVKNFDLDVQTWQKAIVVKEREVICLGENGNTVVLVEGEKGWELSYFVEGFNRKIYCYAYTNSGYMVFGAAGETRELIKKDKWQYGENIEGFTGLIYDVVNFDLETLIVVGAKKQCKPLVSKMGMWKYEDLLEGFPTYISAIKKWEQDSFLVGGWNGQLALLRVDVPRSWRDYIKRIKEKTDIFF